MDKFVIHSKRWFAWQMLPGYLGERYVPYCSPIYVTEFKPLKTSKGRVRIGFLNAMYAQGIQDFSFDVHVLKRAKDYLVGELNYEGDEGCNRCAVISHIEFEWIRRFCPDLWYHRPPSSCSGPAVGSISMYLDEVFFRK